MLLDEIIDLAVDNKHSIAVLLRKCLLLAYELNNDPLKEWANQELKGYKSSVGLPEYRIMSAQAKGNFSGPFQAYIPGRNIPSMAMEKKHRWAAGTINLTEPISAYESLTESEGTIVYPWDNDMVLYYQEKLIRGYALVAAWQEIPKSAIVAILDTIRTRVLNMALEIKSEVGTGNDDALRTFAKAGDTDTAGKVAQSIVNNIYGGTNYFASGQSRVNVQNTAISVGDWNQLEAALRSAGLVDSDVKQLPAAIESDGDQKLKADGTVMGWIKGIAPKVLVNGLKIGSAIGQSVLTEYLMQYYGLK